VDALLIGTGGSRGWPEPGCSCASCRRAAAAGPGRAAGQVLIDGTVRLGPGQPPRSLQSPRSPPDGPGGPAGYQVRAVPGGWDITGPDGGRLLASAGPGLVPELDDAAAPFDIALLDMLASPAQLGLLRARGLLRPSTAVTAMYADHRVTSAEELARRCRVWGVEPGRDGMVVSGPRPVLAGTGPARPQRTLIIGGARSGKSREAELRLSGEPAVTYLAAGPWPGESPAGQSQPGESQPGESQPGESQAGQSQAGQSQAGPDGAPVGQQADARWPDEEWAARVAAHRAGRPSWWRTEESLDVAGALRRGTGALLIDGIGTWLAAVMETVGMWADPPAAGAADQLAGQVEELIAAWRQASGLVVAVTDQVGEGLVPAYPAGRAFRDQLGWLNQRLAAESDLALQVVAGRVVALPA
jgi:adenosylcobinamide kinase / adenosylcobinamide-phosphate guanylyltransferase